MLCQDNTNPHRDDAERPTLFRHITFFLAAAFSGAHSSQQRSRGEREKRGCIIHTQGQKKESQELWSFCVVSKFLDFLIIEGLWIESSSQPQWRYTGNRAPTMSSFPTFFHLPSPSLSLSHSIYWSALCGSLLLFTSHRCECCVPPTASELGGNRWPPRVGSFSLSLSHIPPFLPLFSLETEHLSVIDSHPPLLIL